MASRPREGRGTASSAPPEGAPVRRHLEFGLPASRRRKGGYLLFQDTQLVAIYYDSLVIQTRCHTLPGARCLQSHLTFYPRESC